MRDTMTRAVVQALIEIENQCKARKTCKGCYLNPHEAGCVLDDAPFNWLIGEVELEGDDA